MRIVNSHFLKWFTKNKIWISIFIGVALAQLYYWIPSWNMLLESCNFSLIRDIFGISLFIFFAQRYLKSKQLATPASSAYRNYIFPPLCVILFGVFAALASSFLRTKEMTPGRILEQTDVTFLAKKRSINIVKLYNEYFTSLEIYNHSNGVIDQKKPKTQEYAYNISFNWYNDCDLKNKPSRIAGISFPTKLMPGTRRVIEAPINYLEMPNGFYCIKVKIFEYTVDANNEPIVVAAREFPDQLNVVVKLNHSATSAKFVDSND